VLKNPSNPGILNGGISLPNSGPSLKSIGVNPPPYPSIIIYIGPNIIKPITVNLIITVTTYKIFIPPISEKEKAIAQTQNKDNQK